LDTVRRLLSKVMRPDPRKCEETRALMSDYLEGELDADRRRRVEGHVRFCHRCHTVLGNLRETLARLRGLQSSTGEDSDVAAARIAERWRERA
jgi:anti-sigma factor RsiW